MGLPGLLGIGKSTVLLSRIKVLRRDKKNYIATHFRTQKVPFLQITSSLPSLEEAPFQAYFLGECYLESRFLLCVTFDPAIKIPISFSGGQRGWEEIHEWKVSWCLHYHCVIPQSRRP